MPVPKGHGWFDNHRTLREQMLGLGPALAEARGKTVLDVGCAEGLISFEFVRSGATLVDAFDNHAAYVCDAENVAYRKARRVMRVFLGDMNEGLPSGARRRTYDIVLALAVLHKAPDVPAATQIVAAACSGLMVIRLPHGSAGVIGAKFGHSSCDLHAEMPLLGFALERTEQGPRGELVQYWRKQ